MVKCFLDLQKKIQFGISRSKDAFLDCKKIKLLLQF